MAAGGGVAQKEEEVRDRGQKNAENKRERAKTETVEMKNCDEIPDPLNHSNSRV